MSDTTTCPKCEAEAKAALAVIIGVSVLGEDWIHQCIDSGNRPDWKQAVEIVGAIKRERDDALAEVERLRVACAPGSPARERPSASALKVHHGEV
jgi:hypothetical protein